MLSEGRQTMRKNLNTRFKVWLYNLVDRKGKSVAVVMSILAIKKYEKSISESLDNWNEWFAAKKINKAAYGKPVQWPVKTSRKCRKF